MATVHRGANSRLNPGQSIAYVNIQGYRLISETTLDAEFARVEKLCHRNTKRSFLRWVERTRELLDDLPFLPRRPPCSLRKGGLGSEMLA